MLVLLLYMLVTARGGGLVGFFPSPLHQRFVAIHAKDALRRSRIFQVLNFLLATPTFEAIRTEGLIASKDSQVLDLVVADAAAVGAIVANEGAITEQEEVGIRVQNGVTGIASKAINVPSVAS